MIERRDALQALIRTAMPAQTSALKTRIHGDLHLGQVLAVEDDVVFIDFEGEPRRSLEERRAKHSPLVDVAGMVRSFDYAAHVALRSIGEHQPEAPGRVEPALALWRRDMVASFLAAYHAAAAGTPSYPGDAQEAAALIDLFSLEKALYEIRYELDNRPGWVDIPLMGVHALLDKSDSPVQP
jgi:maltose alpha-D-glucosyltransferase/alpha-amylase